MSQPLLFLAYPPIPSLIPATKYSDTQWPFCPPYDLRLLNGLDPDYPSSRLGVMVVTE